MTVTIREKRTKAGKTYLYLQIAFKDPFNWKMEAHRQSHWIISQRQPA